MTYNSTMEQVAFDIHQAVAELQQLQRVENNNNDETSSDGDDPSNASRDDNDNDSASCLATGKRGVVSHVKIRNDVRRCLRELDTALDRLLKLAMEQQQQQQQDESSQWQTSFRVSRPMLKNLVSIVAKLDLGRLQVQEANNNPNSMIYQSVFQKSILCLREFGYHLDQGEAVAVINRVLLTLHQGIKQGIHYFSRPEGEIERIRGFLSLLNDVMSVKADQQHQQRQQGQGRGGTNDLAATPSSSCLEEVLGGTFDTLEFLHVFLRIGIDCLQDEEMREARATSISQNDVQEGNKLRVENILTFVDFLLMHVHDSMGNTQSQTYEEYFWTLLGKPQDSMRDEEEDNKVNEEDAKYVGRLSNLVQDYTSELQGAVFDEVCAAISFSEAPQDADDVVGNDGDGSTGTNNSSRKDDDCAKSTPSSLTMPSSLSSATGDSIAKEKASGGLRALDVQNASHEVAKMASYPLFVCTAVQVVGGTRGVLDPVKLKEIRSLWVSYSKLFLEVKKYQAANALPLSDDATMAGTDAMIRLGVLAMADIIKVHAEAKEVPLDTEALHVLSISFLAALEFPRLLMWSNGAFLNAVDVVTAQNSKMRHLVQALALRELVFPTSGSTRDPLAMAHVTERLIEIVKKALKSCQAKGTLDRWDCFYRDQLAKHQQQQSQEESAGSTGMAI